MRSRNFDVNPASPKSSAPVRISFGLALAAGGQSWSSPDVTCVRTGTGSYTLNFNPPFDTDGLPIITITPYGGAQYVVVIVGVTQRSVTIVFSTVPSGPGVDTAFMFVVVGQQAMKKV